MLLKFLYASVFSAIGFSNFSSIDFVLFLMRSIGALFNVFCVWFTSCIRKSFITNWFESVNEIVVWICSTFSFQNIYEVFRIHTFFYHFIRHLFPAPILQVEYPKVVTHNCNYYTRFWFTFCIIHIYMINYCCWFSGYSNRLVNSWQFILQSTKCTWCN